jgi:hypothetical protein
MLSTMIRLAGKRAFVIRRHDNILTALALIGPRQANIGDVTKEGVIDDAEHTGWHLDHHRPVLHIHAEPDIDRGRVGGEEQLAGIRQRLGDADAASSVPQVWDGLRALSVGRTCGYAYSVFSLKFSDANPGRPITAGLIIGMREVFEGGWGQGVRRMPMKAETLNPETADLVSAAFDKSWQFVRTDPALAHSDMDEMRIRLSRRLMRLAQDGERDMLRLANGAIGQLRREQRAA